MTDSLFQQFIFKHQQKKEQMFIDVLLMITPYTIKSEVKKVIEEYQNHKISFDYCLKELKQLFIVVGGIDYFISKTNKYIENWDKEGTNIEIHNSTRD